MFTIYVVYVVSGEQHHTFDYSDCTAHMARKIAGKREDKADDSWTGKKQRGRRSYRTPKPNQRSCSLTNLLLFPFVWLSEKKKCKRGVKKCAKRKVSQMPWEDPSLHSDFLTKWRNGEKRRCTNGRMESAELNRIGSVSIRFWGRIGQRQIGRFTLFRSI